MCWAEPVALYASDHRGPAALARNPNLLAAYSKTFRTIASNFKTTIPIPQLRRRLDVIRRPAGPIVSELKARLALRTVHRNVSSMGSSFMKHTMIFACIGALAVCASPGDGRASDNVDEQIAALEKENLLLKKSIRLEALRRENAVLQGKLDRARPSKPRQQALEAPDRSVVGKDAANAFAYANGRDWTKTQSAEAKTAYLAPEQVTPRWAGAYIGGHAGMGFGNWPAAIGSSESCSGAGCFAGEFSHTSTHPMNYHALGGVAGGQAGYLWQVGRFAFGPEIDISIANIGSKKTEAVQMVGGGITFATNSTSEASLKWLSSLRGRVGIAAGDWLFFGTGGLAVAGLDIEQTTLFPEISRSEIAVGYAAGGGLQYAVGPQLSVRAEYLYYGFPEKTVQSQFQTDNIGFGARSNGTTVTVRPSTNVVKVGVDWRLN